MHCAIASVEHLEDFIDRYYDHYVMESAGVSATDNPAKRRKKRDSSTDTADLGEEVSVLDSINKKLDLLFVLHQEIRDLKESLEFTQQQLQEVQQDNAELRSALTSVSSEVEQLRKNNRELKETILDVQARSMRDNLIFSGIPEKAQEDPEAQVRSFLVDALKMSAETANNIGFHRVHRLGQRRGTRPRPIIVKFEKYKEKVVVKGRGRELKGTHYGMNDQFPREINERRKVLYPVLKSSREKGKRTSLVVDKLYVDGQLYRDASTTPWLF